MPWCRRAAAATLLVAMVSCGGSTAKTTAEATQGAKPEPAWGQACPGASDEGDGVRCRRDDECAESELCQPYLWPSCSRNSSGCYQDEDCEGGQLCAETGVSSCFGSGPIRACQAPCTEGSCPEGDVCGGDGHCEPSSCSAGYACADDRVCGEGGDPQSDEHGCRPARCDEDAWSCPAGHDCRPGDEANQNGCVPLSCTAGFECPPNTRCREGSLYLHAHQCEALECARDSDCDCGYCIGSFCRNALAYCGLPPIG
jgi:hypothetical protein